MSALPPFKAETSEGLLMPDFLKVFCFFISNPSLLLRAGKGVKRLAEMAAASFEVVTRSTGLRSGRNKLPLALSSLVLGFEDIEPGWKLGAGDVMIILAASRCL